MPTTPNLDATTLFLCRHGESQWNLAGRIAGGLAQVIAPPDDSHLDGLQPIVTQENHDEL